MTYRIEATRAAERDLAKIAKENRAAALQIRQAVLSLVEDPHPPGSKKLTGHRPPMYRLRSGDYRIIYQVEDEVLLVLLVKIGDRKDIYRFLQR